MMMTWRRVNVQLDKPWNVAGDQVHHFCGSPPAPTLRASMAGASRTLFSLDSLPYQLHLSEHQHEQRTRRSRQTFARITRAHYHGRTQDWPALSWKARRGCVNFLTDLRTSAYSDRHDTPSLLSRRQPEHLIKRHHCNRSRWTRITTRPGLHPGEHGPLFHRTRYAAKCAYVRRCPVWPTGVSI